MIRCLQEITYLTSPGALNPLPSRPPVSLNDPLSPSASDPNQLHDDPSSHDRPRKQMPEDLPPSQFAPKLEVKQEVEEQPRPVEPSSSSSTNGVKEEPRESTENAIRPSSGPVSQFMSIANTLKPPSSPAQRTRELPEEPNGETKQEQPPADEQNQGEEESSQLLTAIYRPGSKAAWREELRAANEEAKRVSRAAAPRIWQLIGRYEQPRAAHRKPLAILIKRTRKLSPISRYL